MARQFDGFRRDWVAGFWGGPGGLLPNDLAREVGRAVDLAEAFQDRPAVHGDGAVGPRVEPEGAAQRMDVAVEDEADDLARAVDHGAAGVAADDVVGGHEVEALRRIEPALRRVP